MEKTEQIGSIHPGEVIREEFLVPLGKTAYWLAKGLGITQTAVGEILQGKRGITPATALRLERFLGCSAEFWLGLQAEYDLDEERARLEPALQGLKPADLSEMTRERQREVQLRLRPLEAALPAERERLAAELAAIQPREQESVISGM
jgi:addiction module HigA family antidote